MASDGVFFKHNLTAGESLSSLVAGTGSLNKPLAVDDGKVANNGLESIGILRSTGNTNEQVTYGGFGFMRYTAGATISAGAQLTVTTSGYMITAGSGAYYVGKNLETSVASGEVGAGFFNFAVPAYFESTSAHISTYETFGFTAQVDLSAAGAVGKAVCTHSGDFGSAGTIANAVLLTGTASGGTSVARMDGKMLVRAGNVVTAGRSLKVTSGWFLNADSGDVIVGRALAASAAGNSGSTFFASIDFGQPNFATNCFHVMYGV